MRYTNKYIKEACFPYNAMLRISSVGLSLTILLMLWGFIATGIQLNNISPLYEVLTKYSNPANKAAYIEIIEVPQKIAEDKYEEYYLVKTDSDFYISGMQKKQYAALKKEVEEKGTARLEGMTCVMLDKQAIEKVSGYINKEHIHLRVTKLSYGGILKEGYIVNLILGGVLGLFNLAFVLGSAYELKKYKHPQAKQIGEECNREDAKWLDEYKICLTKSFLVGINNGLTALNIEKVSSVTIHGSEQNTVIVDAKTSDGRSVNLYEQFSRETCIYVEEKNYLEELFGSRNIDFICGLDVLNEDGSEFEEDEP